MASSEKPPTGPKAVGSGSSDKDGKASLSGTQFLTVAEVAAMMRVSKMTVYRLLHNGDMPSVRVGRSFRVPAGAVHEYLQTSYFDAG